MKQITKKENFYLKPKLQMNLLNWLNIGHILWKVISLPFKKKYYYLEKCKFSKIISI